MHLLRLAKRSSLLLPVLCLLVLGFIVSLTLPVKSAAGINQQLNFQGRLLTSAGAVVADGNYNIEFKIYQDGDGVLGGGDETLKWTETRTLANRVTVRNGYFSVMLGSVTAFGSSVNWNQDTLWLSWNIGGTADTPSWDGEMSPFKRIGSSAYALNSGQLQGLTAANFVQLAQGVQADGSTTDASIFINKTGGTANILQLQKSGIDVLILSNTGALTLQNTTDSATGFQILDADGGAPVLNVDTDNERVGIGKANPQEGLHVFTSSSIARSIATEWGTGEMLQFGGNGNIGPYLVSHTDSSGDSTGNYVSVRQLFGASGFIIETSPQTAAGNARTFTNRLQVSAGGNVGIGDTSPASLLTVGANDAFQVNASGQVVSGTWQGGVIQDTYVANDITIGNTGTVDWTALTNYPAGCDPGEAATGVGDSLTCQAFNTDTSLTLQDAYEGGNTITLDATNGDLQVSNDAGAEILFLDEGTSNVGIGTATPETKLHVVSTAEQLRLGYDSSNHLTVQVASNGRTTLATTGTDADLSLSLAGDFDIGNGNLFYSPSNRRFALNNSSTIGLFEVAASSGTQSDAIPTMTSNTAPSGVAATSTGSTGYQAFDDNINTYASLTYSFPIWISYEFPTNKIITKYTLTSRNSGSASIQTPKDWTFEGWDGDSWVVLDTQVNQVSWSPGEKRTYNVNNITAYIKYRLDITADNGQEIAVTMSEIELMEDSTYDIPALFVDTSGNVGIGTTGPDSKLHVIGGICAEATDTGCAAAAGTVIATNLQGSGSGITNLNASNIASGTLADARLSANVSLLGQSISDAEVDDNITIDATGSVDWTALTSYPAACGPGDAVTAVGDTTTCQAFNTDSAISLQDAYDEGNTISSAAYSGGRDIEITLADTATDSTFEITQAGTADALRINDDGTFTDSTPFVIDATGRVGIGLTSPGSLLQLGSDAGTPASGITFGSAADANLYRSVGDELTTDGGLVTGDYLRTPRVRSTANWEHQVIFGAGSPEGTSLADPGSLFLDHTNGKLYLKETGTGDTGWTDIGAGGTSTLQQAYNASSSPATITTADGKNIRVSLEDTTTDQTLEISQAGTADAFRVNDDGTFTDTSPFVIDAGGQVGIGAASPADLLHLSKSNAGADVGLIIQNTGATAGDTASLRLRTAGSTDDFGRIQTERVGAANSKLHLATRQSSSLVNSLTLNELGNVGIGTTNPTNFKLQVAGHIGPDADNTYDLGSSVNRWKTLHVGPASLVVHNDTTDTNKATLGFSGSTANLSTDNATPLQLTTGSNTGININTSGNVGIGTSGPDSKLHVIGGVCIESSDSGCAVSAGDLSIGGNVLPAAADTHDLGSATLEYDELFVGDDGGVILGVDSDATIKYDEAGDDRVELTGTGASLFIEDRLSLGVQNASIATGGTLTPTASYVALVCITDNGCNVSLGESSAKTGDIVVIQVKGLCGGAVSFSDTSGVSQLAGSFSAHIDDILMLIYDGGKWVEVSRSDNSADGGGPPPCG